MQKKGPEELARDVVQSCAGCGHCRELMEDTPCVFFERLYALCDAEEESGVPATSNELRALLELCNFCGLCPCPNIRTEIREAKDAFVARDGMPRTLKVLQDVQRVGKLCGAYPWISNAVLNSKLGGAAVKRVAGIHAARTLPQAPREGFEAWARARGLDQKKRGGGRKVLYFAGCTARYFFPQVAQATVEVLEHNGVQVYCPELKCCGMPPLLEGDKRFTFELASQNLESLYEAVCEGYEVVCSCPTCGYMLKHVMSEGADNAVESRMAGDKAGARKLVWPAHVVLKGMFNDEGYFAALSPRKRIEVSHHTHDLGEYLAWLRSAGEFNDGLGAVSGRMAYYAPCHQREQEVGTPWTALLAGVPELDLTQAGGPFDCCGMAGIMGFKDEFHHVSLKMGEQLMAKVHEVGPDRLLSDCLSCRMQFEHALPYEVAHPVEILRDAYAKYGE